MFALWKRMAKGTWILFPNLLVKSRSPPAGRDWWGTEHILEVIAQRGSLSPHHEDCGKVFSFSWWAKAHHTDPIVGGADGLWRQDKKLASYETFLPEAARKIKKEK